MPCDKYKLIMFDCDGTLVDSEYLYNSVLSDLLIKRGYKDYSTDRCCELFAGTSFHYVEQYMKEHLSRINIPEFEQEFIKVATHAASKNLKSINGVESTLMTLDQNLKCVVTNSEIEVVKFTLDITNLKRFFRDDQIFAYEMVESPKPAPDLYLLAAETNKVSTKDCITIEDTLVGAQSSIDAGIRTIGFVRTHHANKHYSSELKEKMLSIGVHEVIHDFKDYLNFLT